MCRWFARFATGKSNHLRIFYRLCLSIGKILLLATLPLTTMSMPPKNLWYSACLIWMKFSWSTHWIRVFLALSYKKTMSNNNCCQCWVTKPGQSLSWMCWSSLISRDGCRSQCVSWSITSRRCVVRLAHNKTAFSWLITQCWRSAYHVSTCMRSATL